jgi:alkaline phosphatase
MKWGVILMVLFLLTSLASFQVRAESETPKNVILMIGDGMGTAHITLTRILSGELNMDQFSAGGLATTYSNNNLITDSAAAGTALATGHKTNNGVISQSPDHRDLKTVLEIAKENGMGTGIITTSRITDATPACFYAHTENRDEEDAIAEQLVNAGVDVILGGGQSHFLQSGTEGSKREDSLDLVNEFKNIGYEIVSNKSEMLKASQSPVVGLFTPAEMSFELDRRAEEPSIAEMTKKAIQLLNGKREGFFLMIEGGRIDHEAHANDAAGVVAEVKAFDDAIGTALNFAREDGKTLVIVTADHSTGGLTLGRGTKQWYDPELLRSADISFEKFASLLMEGKDIKESLAEHYGIADLTEEEVKKIDDVVKTKKLYDIEAVIGGVISKRTNIVFTTTQHEGSAVPLLTYGPGAFGGFMDNTEVGETVNELLAGEERNIFSRLMERIC